MQIDLDHDFFLQVFKTNPTAPRVVLEHALVEHVGSNAVVGAQVNVQAYARLGLCTCEVQSAPRPIYDAYWGGEDHDRLYERYDNVVWKISWNGETLYKVQSKWPDSCGSGRASWIVAATTEIANEFILDVQRKTNDPGDAILVFRNGSWNYSTELYMVVQKTSFEDLILADTLKESIQTDFQQFLDGRTQYDQLGLAWRRGALFIGPPGNGKTHCVRALVRQMSVPCLYVQSLQHRHFESEQLLQMVFERARRLRPCVLIFEDLDALVDSSNQSFFLNQLDGFEKNQGLIVLATTNHPDRIDEAIINRPSRFDRKYHFQLPKQRERRRFLAAWQDKLADKVDWPDASVDEIAATTEEFSFAYLKELVVSGLMARLSNADVPFSQHIQQQAEFLHSQMKTTTES